MRSQVISDQELLLQYKEGSETALELLINRHKDKVFTAIYLFVKDRYIAEDLFQDTFIKVVDTLRKNKYREEGRFLPWVMRIAHNICVDYYRRVNRVPTITNKEGFDIFRLLPFASDNAEQKIVREQSNDKIRALIDSLPTEQKEVVILRHYANMSFKQIAKVTNVSINTALGRMRYALINMRKVMEAKQVSI
jgi:RNA polymerase sigma-70 factor (ECF subfamily)